jgi:hypothetical protein
MKKVFKVECRIDKATVKMAIASILLFGSLRVTRNNILYVIKEEVLSRGTQVLDFPENWGEDILDYEYEHEKEVNYWYDRFEKYFR